MVSLTEMAEIADSGLFDGEFYRGQLEGCSGRDSEALHHFCEFGFSDGLRPNPYFDPLAYLRAHLDVAASTLNPLLHYIRHGEREGRRPIAIFDPLWYRAAYALPPGAPLLSHFLSCCHSRIVLPCREAFTFAFEVGLQADRPPPSMDVCRRVERELVAASGLLDWNYYLINGEDVLEADIDPVRHFCEWGWRERRKPNIHFDTGWYLSTNPEVDRLGINPLVHYLIVGERMGRRPTPWFDPIWYQGEYRVPHGQSALTHYIAHRTGREVSPNRHFDVTRFVSDHQGEIGENRDPFVLYLLAGANQDTASSAAPGSPEYNRVRTGCLSNGLRHLHHPEMNDPLVRRSIDDYLGRHE